MSGLFVATFVVSVRLYALNINKPNLDASRKRTERAKRANKSIIFTEEMTRQAPILYCLEPELSDGARKS